jgi:hypothetical protein
MAPEALPFVALGSFVPIVPVVPVPAEPVTEPVEPLELLDPGAATEPAD